MWVPDGGPGRLCVREAVKLRVGDCDGEAWEETTNARVLDRVADALLELERDWSGTGFEGGGVRMCSAGAVEW